MAVDMLQYWLLREPSLAFGLPVYLFAAMLFPLHLGWTGAPLLSLAGYLLLAAVLLSVADALHHRTLYPKWRALIPQSLLSLLVLALPAALAFAIGSALGPIDEAFDEAECARQGAAEVDTIDAEADDTFDVTADCAGNP